MGLFKSLSSSFRSTFSKSYRDNMRWEKNLSRGGFHHDPDVWTHDKEDGYWHNHEEGWGHNDGDYKVSNKWDFD